MLQFHALDCVDLSTPADYFVEHGNVLRVDTSVNCNSTAYKRFFVANSLLIVIYQSVPLVWLCLLWRVRHLLDPMGYSKSVGNPEHSEFEFNDDSSNLDISDELDDSGRKSTINWLERLSHSTGLRPSENQLRSSRTSMASTKRLTEKELIAKERLRLDTDKRATEVIIHLNFPIFPSLFVDFKADQKVIKLLE